MWQWQIIMALMPCIKPLCVETQGELKCFANEPITACYVLQLTNQNTKLNVSAGKSRLVLFD